MHTMLGENMLPSFLPLDVSTSLLVASLAAIPIPGNPARYTLLLMLAYWALKYSSRFTPGRRMRALQRTMSTINESLLDAKATCIFDQASLAYENTRLLRCEHLKIELEQELRDMKRCSWIEYLPAIYHFLRRIVWCINEYLVANETKRRLGRATSDAKQAYETLCSAPLRRELPSTLAPF
ncbi:hypothetical protein C8F01DRAFT_1320887 [Mycena amicta]|nr:hypothetical protein C8F01DRAFT_1320887 [Mycena amicta]